MKRILLLLALLSPSLAGADGYWSLGGASVSTDADPGVSINSDGGSPAFGAGNEFLLAESWSASIDFLYVGAFSVGGLAHYRTENARFGVGVGVVDLLAEAPLAGCLGTGSKTTEFAMADAEYGGFYLRAMQYSDAGVSLSCSTGAGQQVQQSRLGDGTVFSAGYRVRF